MKKPLIVSYSYSGHTHRMAQALCALTGGSLCEIYPWQPYPMAFPELLQQVRKEIQAGYQPRLLSGTSAPKPYSVIFAGSPNWCGHIAPPLASWLAKHDLSGKVILPFYSHCGGVPCDFVREIVRLCPGRRSARLWGSWRTPARICRRPCGRGWIKTDCHRCTLSVQADPFKTQG